MSVVTLKGESLNLATKLSSPAQLHSKRAPSAHLCDTMRDNFIAVSVFVVILVTFGKWKIRSKSKQQSDDKDKLAFLSRDIVQHSINISVRIIYIIIISSIDESTIL